MKRRGLPLLLLVVWLTFGRPQPAYGLSIPPVLPQILQQLLQQIFSGTLASPGQLLNFVNQMVGQFCSGGSGCQMAQQLVQGVTELFRGGSPQALLPFIMSHLGRYIGTTTRMDFQEISQIGRNPNPTAAQMGFLEQSPPGLAPGVTANKSPYDRTKKISEGIIQSVGSGYQGVKEQYKSYKEKEIQQNRLPILYEAEYKTREAQGEAIAQIIRTAPNELFALQQMGDMMLATTGLQTLGLEHNILATERLRATLVWLAERETEREEARMQMDAHMMDTLAWLNGSSPPQPAPPPGRSFVPDRTTRRASANQTR